MSQSTSLPPAPTSTLSAGMGQGGLQTGPLLLAGAGLLFVAVMAWPFGGVRYGVAVVIGALAGFALYHAAFGFTAAWRRIVSERRGQGLRAQMVLLMAACALT